MHSFKWSSYYFSGDRKAEDLDHMCDTISTIRARPPRSHQWAPLSTRKLCSRQVLVPFADAWCRYNHGHDSVNQRVSTWSPDKTNIFVSFEVSDVLVITYLVKIKQ
jgi:hypothetical protein